MIVHITGLHKFGIKWTREFTCKRKKRKKKNIVRTMSRCISSLVKHFNQVSHPSPLFLRNSVHQWSKKVIFLTVSSFLVSPCLASAGLHLFGLGRLGRQLTHFCSEFEQPTCLSLIRPNTVDNIRDVFRDARSIWKHEFFLSTVPRWLL